MVMEFHCSSCISFIGVLQISGRGKSRDVHRWGVKIQIVPVFPIGWVIVRLRSPPWQGSTSPHPAGYAKSPDMIITVASCLKSLQQQIVWTWASTCRLHIVSSHALGRHRQVRILAWKWSRDSGTLRSWISGAIWR